LLKKLLFLLLSFSKKTKKKLTFLNLFGILYHLVHSMRRENE